MVTALLVRLATLAAPGTVASLAAWCAGRGLLLADLHTSGGTLEERFLELIAAGDEDAGPEGAA